MSNAAPVPTVVISVRSLWRSVLEENPHFLYVGRRVNRFGWRESDWSNPIQVAKGVLEVDLRRVDPAWLLDQQHHFGKATHEGYAADFFDRWLDTRPDLLVRLPELAGKVLGCWCGPWKPGDRPIPCHAHRLAVRVNALVGAANHA